MRSCPGLIGRLANALRGRRFVPRGDGGSSILCSSSASALGAALLWVLTAGLAQAQFSLTNSGPYTILQTGFSGPLVTLALPFDLPPDTAASTFSLEFGFATAERDLSDTFFDSFSMTLQSTNLAATALFFTADRSGVAWAPPTPGLVSVESNAISFAAAPFPTLPGLSSNLTVRLAYTVSFLIPDAFAGEAVSLFFDLFDNLNAVASLAYVKAPRLDATGDLGTKARFYRLRSDLPTRIDRILDEGSSVVLQYHFAPAQLELHVASAVGGPYTRDTNATLLAAAQAFSVPRPNGPRFYRVFAAHAPRLTGLRLEGEQLLISFDFDPGFVAVESALSPRAAFTLETNTRPEPPRGHVRVAKPGQTLPPP